MIRLLALCLCVFHFCHLFSFDDKMLYLVDSRENVYLFRGGLPQDKGQFCYKKLCRSFEKHIGKEKFHKDFHLVDICLLSKPSEAKKIHAEQSWFHKYPSKGIFIFQPIYGSLSDPCRFSVKDRMRLLECHRLDGLVALMNLVKSILQSDATAIIYMHCKLGKDRTGEAIACYQMQFLGRSYDQAMKESKRAARRKINGKNINAIKWYAFYLRDVQKLGHIGLIDEN